MRRVDKVKEKVKQESMKFANIRFDNAKNLMEKRFKSSIKTAYQRVEEMHNSLKGQTRSHKSMQLNYGWKRWLMFTKMNALIKNMQSSKRTQIDDKMLSLA